MYHASIRHCALLNKPHMKCSLIKTIYICFEQKKAFRSLVHLEGFNLIPPFLSMKSSDIAGHCYILNNDIFWQ